MKKVLGALFLLVALSGCATTGMKSNTGFAIYTDHTEGLAATSESGSKMGKACTMNVLGIVATGDASIDAAKKNGGISKVGSVDVESFNVLGVYGKSCTIVHGN